jgi:hypothetical protein
MRGISTPVLPSLTVGKPLELYVGLNKVAADISF